MDGFYSGNFHPEKYKSAKISGTLAYVFFYWVGKGIKNIDDK